MPGNAQVVVSKLCFHGMRMIWDIGGPMQLLQSGRMEALAALTRVAQPTMRKRCAKFGYEDIARRGAAINRYVSTPDRARD
jgi:hypothetical protein